jgi:hypothetical protein
MDLAGGPVMSFDGSMGGKSGSGSIKPSAQIILWRDMFVLVEDGKSRAGDYEHCGRLIAEQRQAYPTGVGGLVIIPEGATPPSDEARKAINAVLKSQEDGLLCFCWLVEGTGFPAAIARGILTGIRVFGRFSYPTQIANSLPDALEWMSPYLSAVRAEGVETAASVIATERMGKTSLLSA